MKVNKLLPIAAIFGCYVFGSAAIAQQVCPVGGGTCVTRPGPAPASSYSNARAVDIMIRQPIPVMPTAESLALSIAPLLPAGAGSVTTGIRTASNGVTSTSYFCVSGQGQNLGQMYIDYVHPVYGPGSYFGDTCPAGSGAMILGRGMAGGPDGVGNQ